jgi:hypothetical protein
MGIGNSSMNQNQVYFDPQTSQYYTIGSTSPFGSINYNRTQRNYIDDIMNKPDTKSMTNEMLERARMASQNVNVPSIADLFPLMMQNYQPAPMMQGQAQAPMQSSGAGRFLSASDTAPNLNFGVNTVT